LFLIDRKTTPESQNILTDIVLVIHGFISINNDDDNLFRLETTAIINIPGTRPFWVIFPFRYLSFHSIKTTPNTLRPCYSVQYWSKYKDDTLNEIMNSIMKSYVMISVNLTS